MKRFLGAALICVMAFSAAGCGSGADTASEDEAVAEGETEEAGEGEERTSLIVGLDDTFAPMGFRDEAGELMGFDIDLAEAVGSLMGWEVVFQPIDWDTKEVELETGKIDVIWNGFSYTDERNENMTLSAPYLDNAQIILVPSDSDITSKADLAGKTIGLQDGSSAEDAVNADDMASEIGEIVKYDTNVEAFTDLGIGGRIDAVVADEVVAKYYIETSGADIRVLDDDFGSEVYVIAAKLGNTELMNEIESALDVLSQDGTAAGISEKWFGDNIYIH